MKPPRTDAPGDVVPSLADALRMSAEELGRETWSDLYLLVELIEALDLSEEEACAPRSFGS